MVPPLSGSVAKIGPRRCSMTAAEYLARSGLEELFAVAPTPDTEDVA
jgi:hypothetical protein